MADWEWRRTNRGSTKSVLVSTTYPSDDASYGSHYLFDQAKPIKKYEFVALNAPKSLADEIEANHDLRETPYTLTDNQDDTYTGIIETWEAANVDGTTRETVRIVMLQGTFL